MENQHQKITGYRDLSQAEIDAMNDVKGVGAELEALVSRVGSIDGVDKRWLAIGQTDLQKGLMSVTRAIAKPTSF